MKSILYNTGYFIKEAKTIIKINLLSNIFSLLSTSLIFFMLAMVLSGWWISDGIVHAIQGEAEINIYFSEDIEGESLSQMLDSIEKLEGIREARLIDEGEAYGRMEEILGKEARVLEYLDDNPFSPFLEVRIELEQMESIIEGLNHIDGIEQIRDNRETLERLRSAAGVLKTLGYLIIAAVGITTLVIISHIIRSGIYDNREQINTLRLLGAPEIFISFPFLLEGLILTIGGGLIASFMASFSLEYIYARMTGPLPFIPLPSYEPLVRKMITAVLLLSAAFGLTGSVFGLLSAKKE